MNTWSTDKSKPTFGETKFFMNIKSLLTKALVLSVLFAFAIAPGFAQTKPIKYIGNADTLINSNKTWDCDTIYFLKGKVYVTGGAELTIQPGTVIVGDTLNKGSLIITKGSKIHAVGTPSCPIVFTSSKAPGKRARGDWGGVILLGKSTINQPGGVANIEGIAPGALSEYGGGTGTSDIHDNSGELNYVRIEFAGVALSLNNEINGLTFGGVGDGTLVDFVQVSYANDDSFEWFGGTVNCKHLIAFRGIDDDFDTDNGFSGKIQFGIGLRDPLVADVSGSNGFESDNDASGSLNTPQTRAVFSNMTICAGSDSATNNLFRRSVHIRRNSHMFLYNSIVMGYPTGILIDGTTTEASVKADTIVEHNIVGCKYAPKYVTATTGADSAAVVNLLLTGADNRFYADNTGIRLTSPFNLNNPNLRPATGSPALSGASFNETALNNAFFTPTTYVGALAKSSAQNWAQLWVNWKPTSTVYNGLCICSTTAAAAVAEEEDAIVASNGEVSIYPNPARGTFNVNVGGYTGNVTIKVSNMNGSVVYNKQTSVTAKSVVNVTLKNATAGLYFVTVTNGVQSTTKKINILQ